MATKTPISATQRRTAAYASPRRLAAHVYKTLNRPSRVALRCLEEFVFAAFAASLRTAEGRKVSLNILLRLNDGSWDSDVESGSFFRFQDPRRLETDILVQLAHGLEVDRAGVAAEVADGNLVVAGVVKLAPALVGDSLFLNRLGAIQLSIAAPGHLICIASDGIVAELRDGSLLTSPAPILFQGIVRDRLRLGAELLLQRLQIRMRLRRHQPAPQFLVQRVERARLLALLNLLLSIRGLWHGGSVVINPNALDPAILRVGFSVSYPGIPEALEELVLTSLPLSDGKSLRKKENELRQRATRLAQQRLGDAIRFVARLSSVDGMIVLDEQLRLLGFGAIATSTDITAPVTRAENAEASLLKRYDTAQRGTRHRSVIAVCGRIPHTLGFVISQDGYIRTVLGRGDDVVVWDRFSGKPTAR